LPPYKIQSLGLLALAYALNGDSKNALHYTEMLKDMGGFLFPVKLKNLTLAKIYMALKEYDKLLELNEIFTDSLKVFGDVIIFLALAQTSDDFMKFESIRLPRDFMISTALHETGQIKKAKKGYDKLLSIPQIKSIGEIYWSILFGRGKIFQGEGDTKQAIDFYKNAIDVIEQQRSTINTEANKIGFVGDKQKVYHQMISTLYSDEQYTNAFEYVERSKSRALIDLLASSRNLAIQEREAQAGAMLMELEAIEAEDKAIDVSSRAPDKIAQRETRSIQIKDKLKTIAPELHSLVTTSVPPPAEIKSYINSDETVIEYYYSGEDLYAFILTRDKLNAVKLNGLHLIKEIEQLRASLQDPNSRQYLVLSQKAYQRLIKPFEHLLHTQNLIIVPHGVLHYVPFNALNKGSDYLIDRFSISYLPSASVMKFLKQRTVQKTEQALIIGNPDLGDPTYDLKYAGEEAVSISKGFSQAKVLLRKEATETAFKNLGEQFRYIHFATHGLFESDSPLNSGLFLVKDSENDGLLSVHELYSLRLNADLVTLSACETGLGKLNAGDDVVGLTRGFIYAGSNSVVASLWKVDDLATSQLMAGFYYNLNNVIKRDALRQAQLTIKEQYVHPYYWAAFQLTGIAD
jgi:CHAT domain-containing protein